MGIMKPNFYETHINLKASISFVSTFSSTPNFLPNQLDKKEWYRFINLFHHFDKRVKDSNSNDQKDGKRNKISD